MDAIFLQARNDFVDNVFGQISADIEALKFWVVAAWALDGASGHKHGSPDARPIRQVVIDDLGYFHQMLTLIPFVCLVRLRTSACLPALKARR